jgi:phage tail sheath protein FI
VSGVLDAGYDRFTVPMYGGFDGVNIRELDPFANRNLSGTPSDANNYVFNSIRQSIDAVADPEVVEMNLATIPGLKQPGLTNNLINVCEDRADALAIIDLEGGYQPRAEGKVSARNNTLSSLNSTITSLRQRALNTSYGCCFYPWLRARDTINGSSLWVPPSVAALGTFSSSQKKTQVWFAPAGFNRGGLTEGAAGIPIVDVAHKLTRKNRDDLYGANINPIAKFPAEGIVIFGQKTLQITPSALDRINVRRLMIFVKKRVSQAAATLLFDPNVQTTWNRFISSVTPILSDIKTNFGLSDFKLVLDETTTTPELIDRNIMYARIFLKPTRAIEYIAIDFNITRTGASFDD